MLTFIEKVSVMCFAASYAVAFALELWHLFRPRPIQRLIALGFAAAGLLAHVTYIIAQSFVEEKLALSSPTGSLLLLALILAAFYVGEAIHRSRIAWALFVLPVVLGLIGLGVVVHDPNLPPTSTLHWFWGATHGTLLTLAAVGVSVGCIASIMYLVQLRRLQTKLPPTQGLTLLSLERLETMNRRAILWSFPLLTAGLLAGFATMYGSDWFSLRVLSTIGLWVVSAILLFLRYRIHVRGRQLALWTMFAFAILVVALVSSHDFAQGGGP